VFLELLNWSANKLGEIFKTSNDNISVVTHKNFKGFETFFVIVLRIGPVASLLHKSKITYKTFILIGGALYR